MRPGLLELVSDPKEVLVSQEVWKDLVTLTSTVRQLSKVLPKATEVSQLLPEAEVWGAYSQSLSHLQ